MKRLSLIVSAALVLAAEAKLEKVVDVTLADQQGLVNFAAKTGSFINEPMLAMLPAGLFVANPLATQGRLTPAPHNPSCVSVYMPCARRCAVFVSARLHRLP